jgi:putative ABC transport system substrate-binding protein
MAFAVRLLALFLAAVLLPAAGSAGTRPRVVVVYTLAIEPFEVARSALVEELSDEMNVVELQVDPRDPRASSRLVDLQPQVIVPLGTQATRWAAEAIENVPIVFAMVLDPISGGLVESFQRPGGRITGAALDISLETQFRSLRELLQASRVAVLYNPERSAAIIDSARHQARAFDIELVAIPVDSPAGFEQALRRVDRSFDALWSIPDPMVFSPRLAERILLYSIRSRIPLVGLSEQHVRAGALYSLTVPFTENARQAAELVRRVATGEPAAHIPLQTPETLEIVFNRRTAENLRVPLPQSGFVRLRPVR